MYMNLAIELDGHETQLLNKMMKPKLDTNRNYNLVR